MSLPEIPGVMNVPLRWYSGVERDCASGLWKIMPTITETIWNCACANPTGFDFFCEGTLHELVKQIKNHYHLANVTPLTGNVFELPSGQFLTQMQTTVRNADE